MQWFCVNVCFCIVYVWIPTYVHQLSQPEMYLHTLILSQTSLNITLTLLVFWLQNLLIIIIILETNKKPTNIWFIICWSHYPSTYYYYNNSYFRVFPTGGNTELRFASSVAVVTCSGPVAKRTRCCLWRRTCSDSVWIGSDPVLVRSWFLFSVGFVCWCVTSCRWSALYPDSLMTRRRTGETHEWEYIQRVTWDFMKNQIKCTWVFEVKVLRVCVYCTLRWCLHGEVHVQCFVIKMVFPCWSGDDPVYTWRHSHAARCVWLCEGSFLSLNHRL